MDRTLKDILDDLNIARDPIEESTTQREADKKIIQKLHDQTNLQNELERMVRNILNYPSKHRIPERI